MGIVHVLDLRGAENTCLMSQERQTTRDPLLASFLMSCDDSDFVEPPTQIFTKVQSKMPIYVVPV